MYPRRLCSCDQAVFSGPMYVRAGLEGSVIALTNVLGELVEKYRYTACGHCPQGSDRAEGQTSGRREIAAYLPANGACLAALALMVAGWDGSPAHPGFPDDGSWVIQSEGLHPLP